MIGEDDLEEGSLRMLEVDNRLVIPELTHVRFVITSADVIHAFASPSLGIKCDAYPGRLNQVSVLINREGVFYGLLLYLALDRGSLSRGIKDNEAKVIVNL